MSYVDSLAAQWSLEHCLRQSIFTYQRCHVYNQVTSLYDMYPFPAVYQRIFKHWQKFCADWQTVIFADHFDANRLILRRTVAKWWYIKRCAIFGPLCSLWLIDWLIDMFEFSDPLTYDPLTHFGLWSSYHVYLQTTVIGCATTVGLDTPRSSVVKWL